MTWFGKSERPVATIASGRAFLASSGMISGVGFASAKITGFFAIPCSMSPVTIPATDSPTNTSAPCNASASVRALVSTAKRCLNWSSPSRPW